MAETYAGLDAWDAAEVVAEALKETADDHGCDAKLGDRAPVVLVGRHLSRRYQKMGVFSFEDVYDDNDEFIGVGLAEVPQRRTAKLIRIAKDALERAARAVEA